MLTGMVYLGLQKGLSKGESLGLDLELRQRDETSQTGRQRIPHRWSDKTERAPTKRHFKLRFSNRRKLLD